MLELGVAGVGDAPILASGVVATGPGGGGWEVAGLADPGRTAGLESPMLGFVLSAYPLCKVPVEISTFRLSMGVQLRSSRALTRGAETTRLVCIACHWRPALDALGLYASALDERREARSMTGCVGRQRRVGWWWTRNCEVVDACAGRRLKRFLVQARKLSGTPSLPMMQPPRSKDKATNTV